MCGVAWLSGCAPTETRFDVVAFAADAAQGRFDQVFEDGAFGIDVQNRYGISFHREDVGPAIGEANPADQAPGASGIPLRQWLIIRVFWMPRPGNTYAESTQTNADIIYCLQRGDDVITYEGAGFVYFRITDGGRTVRGRIESATLAPARRKGRPQDYFGRCQLTGSFTARLDRPAVVAARRAVRRLVGPPPADGSSLFEGGRSTAPSVP